MSHTMTGQPTVTFDDDIPSSFVLDHEMRHALRKAFPPSMIGHVNKGFGMVDFIGHAAITDRLNQAAPGWTYRVEPVVIQGKDGLPHVMAVFGTMTVGGVTRQEVGDVEHMTRYGDELKKAISDFIVRGAMRFGVGLDLWSKEQLESPSRETPASLPRDSSSPASTEAGERSAPTRGRHGADAGGRVDKTSSASRASSSAEYGEPGKAKGSTGRDTPTGSSGHAEDSSSEGTTEARTATGTRGATSDPSTSTGGGKARRTKPSREPVTEPPSPAGAHRKYPLDPAICKHTVGIDLDLRCIDCGTQMAEASA